MIEKGQLHSSGNSGYSPCQDSLPIGSKIPFVLVHGTWHGGWCWDEVAARLRAAGHEVMTPTLPGLAGDSNDVHIGIDLADHTRAVVELIDRERMQKVVLVGHSYGGMVISGVADRRATCIHCIVYLDAFLPKDGDSVATLLPQDRWLALEATAKRHESGTVIPPPDAHYFPISDELAQRITPRLSGQPINTFRQAARLPNGGHLGVSKRIYISCDAPAMETFETTKRALRGDAAWKYHSLATGHEAMLSQPDAVANLLLEVAAG
ncbi:alpha/beta hydrolase [Paraburkholderia sediminicola]|uniref:alpha/beta hydrolase n=1 Tax=Paraburkholderia sediminicola TaxID=458836 RepID=UPI0038BD1EEC